MYVSRRRALGIALLVLAALTGPAVFAVALWQQTEVAAAVGAIERDPSCSAPIAQRMYDGLCLTISATVRSKYVDGDGWNSVYHAVVSLPGKRTEDVSFLHAPSLYHRIPVGHAIIVRLFDGSAVAVGVGNLAAAAGDGPLLDRRQTWAYVRDIGVSMMLFEVLVAAVFFTVKHVRRGALPRGQDGLWI
jgi:hypothetical protein